MKREACLDGDLLATAEAARLLGRTPDTVRAMARRGALPVAANLANGQRLFSRRLIERLVVDRDRAVADPLPLGRDRG